MPVLSYIRIINITKQLYTVSKTQAIEIPFFSLNLIKINSLLFVQKMNLKHFKLLKKKIVALSFP